MNCTLKKKYAIIFPGNLGTYFKCIDNIKKLCTSENIDIYILYSNTINYCHTELYGLNIDFKIDKSDIQYVENTIGTNIKYFKAIEDEPDYLKLFDKYSDIFLKNIEWAKDIDTGNQFNYNIFMNKSKLNKFLDQFIRTYYLYKEIEKSGIDYDYIIRMRIDQYYTENVLNIVFKKLEENDIDFLWKAMDNFYIVGKNNYHFFKNLVDNLGTIPENSTIGARQENIKYDYSLGPERQFNSIVNTYVKNIKYFHDLEIPINISISIFNNKYQFQYIYINNNWNSFGRFCAINNISLDNYENKLINNENIIVKEHTCTFSKYSNYIFWVYTIY